MLARIRKAKENEGGFTLIELLVVVIIIGILAAIAIPTFLNQRRSGWEAQAKSALRNAVTNAEAIATTNNGNYSTVTSTNVAQGIGTSGGRVSLAASLATADDFCIAVTHLDLGSTASFHYRKATVGTVAGDTIRTGACPAS